MSGPHADTYLVQDVDALTLRLDDLRAQVSDAVERRDAAQQAAYRAAREADDLGAEWRRVKRALEALPRAPGDYPFAPDPGDEVPGDRWGAIGRVAVVLSRYRQDWLSAASLSRLRKMVDGGHYPHDRVPDPCGLIDARERETGRRHDGADDEDAADRRPHLLADTPRCRA